LLVGGALALAAAVGIFLLRGALPEKVDPAWERMEQTGLFRVCTDPSWPPFEFVNPETGRIEGFDADLARLLAQRMWPDVRAEIVPVGFDSLYDALLADRCDALISALPYEPMRTEDVVFSVAYFNAGLVIVVAQETRGIEHLQDLKGRVVGVEWGFVPEGDRRQQSFLRDLGARRYDTAEDVLRALEVGEVEAAIVDRLTALTQVGQCQDLTIVGEPLTDINYVIPVRPENYRLLSAINEGLLKMRKDGTLETLQERWF
jgi:ABC-type amino acid transport substrate-binding protein